MAITPITIKSKIMNKNIQALLDKENTDLKTWSMQQIALTHSKTTLNALMRALRVVKKGLYKSTAQNQSLADVYDICDAVLNLMDDETVEIQKPKK